MLLSLAQLYVFIVIARSISSFFPIKSDSPFAPIVGILYKVTEPVFQPIRRVIPPLGGFDLTPLVVIIGVQFLASLLTSILGV